MTRKRWFTLAVTLLAIGGGLLGLASIKAVETDFAAVSTALQLLGGCLIGAGLLSFAVPLLPEAPVTDYDQRRARRNDLKEIFELCSRLFDGEVSSLNLMKKWYRHNGDIFWVIERTKRKRGFREAKLVGYFSIIPLTAEATKAVLDNELPGTNFTRGHIVKDTAKAKSFYIGGVAASMWRAKAHTLNYLKARTTFLEEQFGLPFLTRPITSDGLRLAEKYDFDPVSEDIENPLKHIHIRALVVDGEKAS